MNNKPFVSDNPYSIFRMSEALTCWQAVMVMAASFLVAILLFTVGGMLMRVSGIFTFLFGLLGILSILSGINGAGICLTDLVKERPYRGIVGYLLAGLFSLPKLLGAGILMLLAYLGVLLAVALLLLISKLPGLGPVLLVAVIPVSVLAVLLTLVGFYMAGSLVAPAIWDGERVMHALSITWAITRKYPFAAIGKIIGGFLLSALFGSIVFGLLGMASLIVGAMAAPIIGSGMNFDVGMMFGGHGNGHLMGAGLGYGLVFASAAAFVSLLPLMVGILTWHEFSGKVDRESIRQQTDSKLEQMNHKVNEMKEKAQTAAAPAPAPTPAPVPAATVEPTIAAAPPVAQPAPAPAAAEHQCPQCQGAVQAGDRFCEHCGHKLF